LVPNVPSSSAQAAKNEGMSNSPLIADTIIKVFELNFLIGRLECLTKVAHNGAKLCEVAEFGKRLLH
jgi:hypothetical protein